MATATGLQGDVTFSSGYTDQVDSWEMSYFATPQDNTSFQPVDDHQTLCPEDVIQGAEGQYTAKLCVSPDSDITGLDYEPYARMWAMRAECKPLMATAFQDNWHSWEPGLISTQFRMLTWLDDTLPLPVGGTGTANLLVSLGTDTAPDNEYVIPYVTTASDVGVSVEGDRREARIEGVASGAPTISGMLPYVGEVGSATFGAASTTDYTCDILTTAVEVRVDRPAAEGQVTIEYVVNGTLA